MALWGTGAASPCPDLQFCCQNQAFMALVCQVQETVATRPRIVVQSLAHVFVPASCTYWSRPFLDVLFLHLPQQACTGGTRQVWLFFFIHSCSTSSQVADGCSWERVLDGATTRLGGPAVAVAGAGAVGTSRSPEVRVPTAAQLSYVTQARSGECAVHTGRLYQMAPYVWAWLSLPLLLSWVSLPATAVCRAPCTA
jgi:hypothetical protein